MSDAEFAIDVQGLNKRFGDKHVVRDLNMRVRRGAIYGFLGPNGSGKTTSIRMLCGLLTPDSGSGTCLGFDIRAQSHEIKRRVGYMTQRFSWYEDLSIAENLDFAARVYGMNNRKAAVHAALTRLGLLQRQTQLAGTLSGGWKQRLALAACLLHEPQLLLLDEPTAGVDPKARREFWDEIHELAAQGVTVLVATHYMDEAERCHRLAYIAYGSLLAEGTPEELLAQVGLTTWAVSASDLQALAAKLKALPGVEQVVPFGQVLHVSGTDAERLEASIRGVSDHGQLDWVKSAPSLEDAFIKLMQSDKPAAP